LTFKRACVTMVQQYDVSYGKEKSL
jgi:hypothetical protein